MNRLWIKIALGALVVFGVGMTGVTLSRRGVTQLKSMALGSLVKLKNPLPALVFRLDGHRLGAIRLLEINNGDSWGPKSIQMAVVLDQTGFANELTDCRLTASHRGNSFDRETFRCADQSEVEDGALQEIGQAVFEPAGLTRPIYLRARDIAQLDRSGIHQLKAKVNADEHAKTVNGDVNFDIEGRHGDRQRGSVKLNADDHGAFLLVRDESGREVVNLRADDNGVSFNVNDKAGRRLLKLIADQTGASIKIDAKDHQER
ncbi:MAG: hypothetical protein ABI647_07035 [Gemmatimonadota bacterium]